MFEAEGGKAETIKQTEAKCWQEDRLNYAQAGGFADGERRRSGWN